MAKFYFLIQLSVEKKSSSTEIPEYLIHNDFDSVRINLDVLKNNMSVLINKFTILLVGS